VHDLREVERDGLRFNVDLADRLGLDFFYGYAPQTYEAALAERCVDPGDTVIDVGANFGYFSIVLARAVAPDGTVHAFEPDPSALELLRRNAAMQRGGAIEIHPTAAAEALGTADFFVMEESAFSGLADTGRSTLRETAQVQCVPLDVAIPDQAPHRPTLIKIDVEGHEGKVLAGARALIRAASDPLLMVEISAKNLTEDRRADVVREVAWLYDEGFVAWERTGDGVRRLDLAQHAREGTDGDLLFARGGGERERRLLSAAASLARRDQELTSELTQGWADSGALVPVSVVQLLDRRDGEIARLRHESGQRAEELREAKRELSEVATRLRAVEQDSEARLREILNRDERIKELHEERRQSAERGAELTATATTTRAKLSQIEQDRAFLTATLGTTRAELSRMEQERNVFRDELARRWDQRLVAVLRRALRGRR
jgi:FkbM family methyltransferase